MTITEIFAVNLGQSGVPVPRGVRNFFRIFSF